VTELGSPPYAIAEADNGDQIFVQGNGAMDVSDKTAEGGGTVVHRNAQGDVVGTGTFEATRLLSFQFYGCGGPGLPDEACGGLAKLAVTLTPEGTSLHFPGTLWIDCLIGDFPPSGVEGVRLNVKGEINFNKSLSPEQGSGFTVFVQP